jgi:hypothetical protein
VFDCEDIYLVSQTNIDGKWNKLVKSQERWWYSANAAYSWLSTQEDWFRECNKVFKARLSLTGIEKVSLSDDYYDTRIDCAAVKSTDGQIWTGKRHHHCIKTIIQAGLKVSHGDQGFMTASGKYVTREQGAKMVLKTGQCKLNNPPLLYSEDLY